MAATRTTRSSNNASPAQPAAKSSLKRASADDPSPAAAPRKRGRPSKNASANSQAASSPQSQPSTNDNSPAIPPRKRGRPSKNASANSPVAKASPKRSIDSPPAPRKRGRPPKKTEEQKTIEETIDPKDVDGAMKDVDSIEDGSVIADQINGKADNVTDKKNDTSKDREEELEVRKEAVKERQDAITKKESDGESTTIKKPTVKTDAGKVKDAARGNQEEKSAAIDDEYHSVIPDEEREAAIPSSILEKGIIYFFFRGRVGVEDPQGIEDVARSYIVLRPLPLGAKLGEGPLEDSGNARLLALPKKMLPKSKQDRFLMFVEKGAAYIKDLRKQFSGNQYATKTSGTRTTPAATPFAEGIYAITTTGRESHLAYHLTVPHEIGEIQKELGLNLKGSFVLSAKNPNASGPANTTLNTPAQYPENIQKRFRNLRWMPLEPELLNYENTQFLVIGEGMGELGNAVMELSVDKKDDRKEKPVEELEKLGEEDHDRVEGLKEDDPVFADLGMSSKEYHKLQTTW